MTTIEQEGKHEKIVSDVYGFLTTYAVGRKFAISAGTLSELWDVTERKLRDIINEIRTSPDFEKVIGSCSRWYFVCANEEEVRSTNESLRHHALSELQVYWANERKAGRNGQGKIIFGDDGEPFIEALAKAE